MKNNELVKPHPRSREELLIRIAELKKEKNDLEVGIGSNLQELALLLNPVTLIRKTLTEVIRKDAEEEEPVLLQELFSKAVGLVVPETLLRSISGKIGGALLSKGVQRIVTNLLVNNRDSIGKGLGNAWNSVQNMIGRILHRSNGVADHSNHVH